MRNFKKNRKNLKFLKRSTQRNSFLSCGTVGLRTLDSVIITNTHLEVARLVINRILKRQGKIHIKAKTNVSITKKASETRMGKGKGSISHYASRMKKNALLFEISGVSPELAILSLKQASKKMPCKTQIIFK